MAKRKHSKSLILKVLDEYFKGGLCNSQLAKKYSISPSTLTLWTLRYEFHGEAAFDSETDLYKKYTAEFKHTVLKKMNDEQFTADETTAFYNIGGKSLVLKWLELYNKGGIKALKPKRKSMPQAVKKLKEPKKPSITKDMTPEQKLITEQQSELEYLRAEVAYLKKLDALIRSKKSATKKKQ